MDSKFYLGKWIQSKAIKGYVADTGDQLNGRVWLVLCPWHHCAYGWMETRMGTHVMPRDVQFLDQEEAALYVLGNLGK